MKPFDFLFKHVPEAEKMLEPYNEEKLIGHGERYNGQLTFSQWNWETGMVTYLGFESPAKPNCFVTDHGIIDCKLPEIFQFGWYHRITFYIEQMPLWSTANPDIAQAFWLLHNQFEKCETLHNRAIHEAQNFVLENIEEAIDRYRIIKQLYKEKNHVF